MKLNTHYFYCFGCGAAGDVIDLTAQWFDLGCLQAARKLSWDFGISPECSQSSKEQAVSPQHNIYTEVSYTLRVLCRYLRLLKLWKKKHIPLCPTSTPDERFVEACLMLDKVNYLVECFLYEDESECCRLAAQLNRCNQIGALENRLNQLAKEKHADGKHAA